MDDTTKGSIFRLGSAVEALALNFSGFFEPSIKPVINTLVDFVNYVGQFIKDNPRRGERDCLVNCWVHRHRSGEHCQTHRSVAHDG